MNLLRWRGRERTSRAERAGSLERVQPLSRVQRLALVLLTYVLIVTSCGVLDLGGFAYFEAFAAHIRQGVFYSRNADLVDRAAQQIVLVLIHDGTFQALPGRPHPPVPRRMQARLVRDLNRAGARLIAFDLVFDVPGPDDAELAAAVQATGGRVLWASHFDKLDPLKPAVSVPPVASLRRASRHYGHIEVPTDPDIFAVDSIEPFLVDEKGHPVPAFSVAAAQVALGQGREPVVSLGAGGWSAGSLRLPADRHGRFKITYLGKPGDVFKQVFYEDIYGNVGADFFRGKIVLVGDVTTVGNDYRFTPVGNMAGVEMHAHALANFLNRIFVADAPAWVNIAALCLLAALVVPLAATLPVSRTMLAASGLVVAYGIFNVWLFATQWVELHFFAPAVGMWLTAMTIVVERALLEERENRRMQGLLRRYVSPQVAAYVIANPDKCVLGGEKATATVLFSDIRGFTTLSEGLAPEEVVARLNEYLQAMTTVVFRHEGTIDKYMGDGIMALFGVPVPHVDHARRAVRTALDMEAALFELQAQWRAQGLPVLDIGIGIHTGEMVVGHIGARERQDFTVVGDSVNLASRVEGMSKELKRRILITEATYRLVANEVEAQGPFPVMVRGKAEPVSLYEVRGWRSAEQAVGPGLPHPVPSVTPRTGWDAPVPMNV